MTTGQPPREHVVGKIFNPDPTIRLKPWQNMIPSLLPGNSTIAKADERVRTRRRGNSRWELDARIFRIAYWMERWARERAEAGMARLKRELKAARAKESGK